MTDSTLRMLYLHHHRWLFGRLLARMGHREDAEDLASETFVQVATAPTGETIHEPRAYLTTIAKRLLFHFWRRRDLEQAYLAYLETLPETLSPSPEDRVLILETLGDIDRRLDGLPLIVRSAFLHAQLDGMGHDEIAETLGVSVRTVGRYLRQAMLQCCEAAES